MIDIKTLALKHGANLFYDLYPDTTSVAFNDMVRFQAFADELLSLSSSEPVGEIIHIYPATQMSPDVKWLTKKHEVGDKLFKANPLNQQLLTERNELIADIETYVTVANEHASEIIKIEAERNECVEEIKRLREALEMYGNADFYFGCSFIFDRPTGGFDEDFTDEYYSENGLDYERPMPGKLANETLDSTTDSIKKLIVG